MQDVINMSAKPDRGQQTLKISTLQGKAEPFIDTFVEFDFPKKGEKLTKAKHFREWFRHLRCNWGENVNDILMERNKDKYDQKTWEGLLQSGLVKKDENGEYWFVKQTKKSIGSVKND